MGQKPPELAPTIVIGHKNPDTDAICSAIGYAEYLRRAKGGRVAAAACGVMNTRTAWVLNEAKVEAPGRIMDVRPTAGDICRRDAVVAKASENFLSVYERISEGGYRTLPVIDDKGCPLGMVSMLALLHLVLPEHAGGSADSVRGVRACLDSILEVLGGTVAVPGRDPSEEENLVLTVAGSSTEAFAKRTEHFAPEETIVIVGDRPLVHQTAIERGVRLLVLTGGFELEDDALATMARSRGTAVILSPHDTGSTLQLIRCARRVAGAVDEDVTIFKDTDSIDLVRATIDSSNHSLFLVVDPEDGTLVGVLSKSDLVNPPLRRIVLVDHNEFSQAVDGAEQAEIVEVIDHHRLSGNLITKEPIRFINDPVGSTSTIVARFFREADLEPERGTAICLMAGLISDTLNLSSPTATKTDAEILVWLAGIAGVEANDFAKRFFEVGSVLGELSCADAIGADRKEYEENGWRISISQIEELGLDVFEKKQKELQKELDHLVDRSPVDFACLMVTDITLNNSVLLTAGPGEVTAEIGYPELDHGLFSLRGVVSRKKQVFPFLSRILARMPGPKVGA